MPQIAEIDTRRFALATHTAHADAGSGLGRSCQKWKWDGDGDVTAPESEVVMQRLAQVNGDVAALPDSSQR